MEAIRICGVDGRYAPTYYCFCSLGCSFYKIAIYLIQCPISHYPAHHTKSSLLLIIQKQERSSTIPYIWCKCLWSYKIKEWGKNCFMHQPQPRSWHNTRYVHMEFVLSTHCSNHLSYLSCRLSRENSLQDCSSSFQSRCIPTTSVPYGTINASSARAISLLCAVGPYFNKAQTTTNPVTTVYCKTAL